MNIFENTIIPKIYANLYLKKVTVYTVEGAPVSFKCATINEFVELIDKCKKLLKTDIVISR